MSTRSFICKEQPNGQYYGVYCHHDGYLTYVGAMLLDHYSTAEKVDELLSFGDLSVLNEKIHPDATQPHSFNYNERQSDVCVFYGRDRGEDDTEARIITPEKAVESWGEYMYVFGLDGVWRHAELCGDREQSAFRLIGVKEALDAEYKALGIERPKDFYGYLSNDAIVKLRHEQEIMYGYDETLSFNENLINRVRTELDEFKKKMLDKSPIAIYNEAGKIRFYEFMGSFIQYEDIDEKDSEIVYKSDRNVLAALWDTMLDLDDFNIGNADDASFLITEYISDCKAQAEQM